MTRYFLLPYTRTARSGPPAKAPTGNGGECIYEHLTIKKNTLKNIRAGE